MPDYGGYLQFRRSVRVPDVAGPFEPEPESDSESGCGGDSDGTSASGLSIRLKPDSAGRNPTTGRLVRLGLAWHARGRWQWRSRWGLPPQARGQCRPRRGSCRRAGSRGARGRNAGLRSNLKIRTSDSKRELRARSIMMLVQYEAGRRARLNCERRRVPVLQAGAWDPAGGTWLRSSVAAAATGMAGLL